MPAGFSNIELYDELNEFVKGMLENFVYKISGTNHYHVICQHPDWIPVGNAPVIYIYRVEFGPDDFYSPSHHYRNVSFRIGIKRINSPTRQKGYGFQISTLHSLFGRYWMRNTFDLTFKTVSYTDKSMYYFGFRDVSSTGMLEIQDEKTKTIMHEFGVSASIHFPVPLMINS